MLLHAILAAALVTVPLEEERAPTVADQERVHDGCEEAPQAFAIRRRNLQLGLLLPAVPLTLGALIVLATSRTTAQVDGDTCVGGKPCGATCIAVSDTCHIDARGYRQGAVAGSVVLSLAALGLLIAGLIAPAQMERRRVACSTAGCSLMLRF